ncbi:phage portal protein [Mycobacterium eburneum]|nr:phage portal protein [Mycobacterium eburneum]TDH48881.1 phage portal protein [Mycobacterium eburneum]
MAVWPFNRKAKGPAGEEQRAFTGWPWDTGGPPPYVAVGVQRALSLVPVYGAARVLGDNVAALTPALYTVGPDGVWNRQKTPSLFVQPSIHGTLFDWLQRAVHSMALWGDAVGYVTSRDYYGFPTMVEWLNPEQVTVMDGSEGNASYNSATGADYNTSAFTGKGSYMDPVWYWRGREMDRADIVHIPWFTMPYKVRGLSPIGAYQTIANAGLGAQDFASAWFLHGGTPPGVFKNTAQTVSKEDADIVTERVVRRLAQRKPLVHGSDWDYTPITMKAGDAAFVETAQLTANHIAVIYGLPAEMLGGQTGNSLTYNTVTMNALNFLQFSLRPWLVRIEAALSALFPRGTFVKFDTTELLRMDPMTKAQVDALSLGYYPPAWRSITEVRAGNDLPPVDPSELVPPYRPGQEGVSVAEDEAVGSAPDPAQAGGAQPENTPSLGAHPDSRSFGPIALMDILARRPLDPIGAVNESTWATPR